MEPEEITVVPAQVRKSIEVMLDHLAPFWRHAVDAQAFILAIRDVLAGDAPRKVPVERLKRAGRYLVALVEADDNLVRCFLQLAASAAFQASAANMVQLFSRGREDRLQELREARRDCLKLFLDLMIEPVEAALDQIEDTELKREERRAALRDTEVPVDEVPSPGEILPDDLVAGQEMARIVVLELRDSCSAGACRALAGLLAALGAGGAALAAQGHGVSEATVSRARHRLGEIITCRVSDASAGLRRAFVLALPEELKNSCA